MNANGQENKFQITQTESSAQVIVKSLEWIYVAHHPHDHITKEGTTINISNNKLLDNFQLNLCV